MRIFFFFILFVILLTMNSIKNSFPWESAYTGRDVTQPCCPLVGKNQQHVTADISYGLRNYVSITHDFKWLYNEGCELSHDIGEFWNSRVQFNKSSGFYDISGLLFFLLFFFFYFSIFYFFL